MTASRTMYAVPKFKLSFVIARNTVDLHTFHVNHLLRSVR